MPYWTRKPNTDQRIKLAITGFKNGLYKNQEDAIKLYSIDLNILYRQFNGKYKSHRVAHIY